MEEWLSVVTSLVTITGLPVLSLVWFIVDLVLFLKCPKEDTEKRKKRRIQLILSGILAFIFVGGIALLMYIIFHAVEHM